METSETFPVKLDYPCPADFYGEPGIASGHYFHQDLLVARQIFKNKPKVHMDVGSRVDGFVAHVASFREIEVLDIRPASKKVRNIRFRQFDLTKPSSSFLSYCDSLSCLHTLEHMGLGRYGDSLSANGYITGLETLHSILKTGGTLYLSVPIGPQRVEFNAHRVFSVRTILDLIKKDFSLQDFSYVDDYGDIHESVPLLEEAIDTSFDCWYGCGIFQLQKK
ncbi:MAG: DUF268 domain-containing protein [Chloroflexi bacterium]|nr:DUF268 domain-containing protein [Chloroflexota bacterium]